MDDTVKNRYGEFLIEEEVLPVAEFKIRRKDEAFLLIEAADDLIDQSRPLVMKREIAPLIKDEEIVFHDPFHDFLVLPIAFGLNERVDELMKREILHRLPSFNGDDAKRYGQVGFPRAHVAIEDKVLLAFKETDIPQCFSGKALRHLNGGERIGLKRLDDREVRGLHTFLSGHRFARAVEALEKRMNELFVGLVCERRVDVEKRFVDFEPFLKRHDFISHRAPPG